MRRRGFSWCNFPPATPSIASLPHPSLPFTIWLEITTRLYSTFITMALRDSISQWPSDWKPNWRQELTYEACKDDIIRAWGPGNLDRNALLDKIKCYSGHPDWVPEWSLFVYLFPRPGFYLTSLVKIFWKVDTWYDRSDRSGEDFIPSPFSYFFSTSRLQLWVRRERETTRLFEFMGIEISKEWEPPQQAELRADHERGYLERKRRI